MAISSPRQAALTAQAAFPWAPEAYPGLERGSVEVFHGKAADPTIKDWRCGRYAAPDWAIAMMQEYLRARIKRDSEAVAELEKEKGRRK